MSIFGSKPKKEEKPKCDHKWMHVQYIATSTCGYASVFQLGEVIRCDRCHALGVQDIDFERVKA